MARNKDLNQKMKDERREQILSNALILFAAKGLSATKITDISAASGISQGLLYHYFESKEEIHPKNNILSTPKYNNWSLDGYGYYEGDSSIQQRLVLKKEEKLYGTK